MEPTENLEDAVVREIKEETGIDATVLSLLGMKEESGHNFDRNDLYFVYLL